LCYDRENYGRECYFKLNISLEIKNQICEIASRYGAQKIILFGSRARGDHHSRSDIDLAVYGIPLNKQGSFSLALEDELNTLLKLDIVHITEHSDAKLLANIEKDGVVLMEKMLTKYENFCKAFERLKEAVNEYEQTHSTTVRDGVIQRFEFTCELAWKSTREYLLEQGFIDVNSPKATMKEAFSCGLIDNDVAWSTLLTDRNLTSHIYDELTAEQIYERILKQHISSFEYLIVKLKENI